VGEYVSGAILTVCFKRPHRVVDANIARFINRFFGLRLTGEIRRKKAIRDLGDILFNVDEPGRFLFAILDFSAAVCRSKNPSHLECPLQDRCKYYRETRSSVADVGD
jgi:A/G-specific adenine glycosylase